MSESFEEFCNENLKEELEELRKKRLEEKRYRERIKDDLIFYYRTKITKGIKEVLKQCTVGVFTRFVNISIELIESEEKFIIRVFPTCESNVKPYEIFLKKEGERKNFDICMYRCYEDVYVIEDCRTGYTVDFWKDVLDEESCPIGQKKVIKIYLD